MLHLTIEREALHVALAQTARVVERRNTIPILSNVLLEAEGGTLTLTATDLDIEARVKAPAVITTPGTTTVPAGLFSGLVAKMPVGSMVSLDLDAGGSQLTVKAGRARATLNALPSADFPRLEAEAFSHSFALDAAALTEAIDAVAFAISTEEIRYYLNGIYVHVDNGQMIAVATDGHRLSRWFNAAPEGAEGMPGIIIPRKAVGEFAKVAAEGKKAGHTSLVIALSDAKIRVEIGPTVLTSKLIDGTFPDYRRVIPAEWESEVTLETAGVSAAVDRVMTINSERGRAIRLSLDKVRLSLDSTNPDAGTALEEVAISGGPDSEFVTGFNGRYLAEVLGALASETVVMRLPKEAGSPTIFVPAVKPQSGADRLIVLMPMRI